MKVVKCPTLPHWEGMRSNTTLTVYRTRVSYSCSGNYTLRDGNTSKVAYCNSTGQWEPDIISCSGTSKVYSCHLCTETNDN